MAERNSSVTSKKSTREKESGEPASKADVPDERCVVVAIGASAGGLDAYQQFLQAMPGNSGMAFVLIQHLDPSHQSLMAELLSRHTEMPVQQVEGTVLIEPDHVYMIPPNKYLKIEDGWLHLDEPVKQRGMRMPIDYFFRSLAGACRERAIAVVLSGTGTDGTLGIKEIKGNGGVTIVQNPDSAQHDGMPRSALATGMIDLVLPIAEIPDALLRFIQHPYIRASGTETLFDDADEDHFRSILSLLRAHTEYDFRCYKQGTLKRRIQRRMGLNHIQTLKDYLSLLRRDRSEVSALFKDLLISVTSFFREPDAFSFLEEEVLAKLVAQKKSDESIRVWVPGCATGEEAFSISMLLHEQFEKQARSCDVQIFGTDLDASAIDFARTGAFPLSIATDLTPSRLSRFFQEVGQCYRVNKRLRESSVFAVQNLISDPPFSNLDLISCRNVMIYLEHECQDKLMQLFHFALREEGCLFLGSSETIGRHSQLFQPVSESMRIYRKTPGVAQSHSRFPIASGFERRESSNSGSTQKAWSESAIAPAEIARRSLLDRFAPASAVIDHRYNVKYYHGPVRQYLDIPTGEPTTNLVAMVLDGLRNRLRGLIQKVITENETASGIVRRVQRQGEQIAVRMTVEPLSQPKQQEPLLLVCFFEETKQPHPITKDGVLRTETPDAGKTSDPDQISAPATDSTSSSDSEAAQQDYVNGEDTTTIDQDAVTKAELELAQVEYELQTIREDLQSTIEEMETSNEELKASNEEVMSMNEELQSSNEELETSREELQSLNEELSTVNAQLEDKVDELEATNNDLDNLLTSTEIATVFLDTSFRIRRFTPAASELFNLILSDVGRPISDLAPRVNDPWLLADSRKVLRNLVPIEKEVEVPGTTTFHNDDPDEMITHDAEADMSSAVGASLPTRWFIRRSLPYRTSENVIDGVVITFTEITQRVTTARRLEQRERQQAVVAELGQLALEIDELQPLFDQAVRMISDTLGTNLTKVLELHPDGKSMLLRAGVGWKDGLVGNASVGAGLDSQAGYTLQSISPVIVHDLRTEKRFRGPALLNEHQVISGMSCIIGSPDAPWGVLGTHSTQMVDFNVDDINFLVSVANTLTAAVHSDQTETEVKRALDRVAFSEHRLQLITDTVPGMIAQVNREQRFEFVNAAYEHFFDRERSGIVGHTIRETVGEVTYSHIQPYIERVLSGECVRFEKDLKFPGHGIVSTVINYVPQTDADGNTIGFYALIVDVSEIKQLQRDLEVSRNRLETTLNGIRDGFVSFDRDWQYLYANPTASKLLKKPVDEMVGHCIWDVFPEIIGTPFETALRRCAHERVTTEVEEFYESHNCWYYCRMTPTDDGVSVFFFDVTERRSREQRERENRDRLRLALEAGGMGTWEWTVETNRAVWDETQEALMGLKPGEFDGNVEKHFFDRVHPDDAERLNAILKAALSGNEQYRAEFRVILPDGSIRWLAGEGRVRRPENSSMTLIGVNWDITDRMMSEQELYTVRERQQLAVDAAHVGIYEANIKTGDVYWSPEFRALAGLDPEGTETVSYGDVPAFVHPDDRTFVAERIRASFDPGGNGTFDEVYRFLLPDGEIRWILMRGRTFFEGSGHDRQAVKAVGTIIDVTNERRGIENERRLAAIVQGTEDAIISFELDGTITSWNSAACRIYGFTSEEAIGQSIELIMPARQRMEMDLFLKRIARNESLSGIRTTRRRKDGQVFQISLTLSPLRDADGQVIGASGIARDITDRIHSEIDEAILKASEEERQRIAQDLHDGIGQELTGLSMMAQSLAERSSKKQTDIDIPAEAGRIAETLRQTQASVRRISRGLLPVEVDSKGLMWSLENLARRTSESTGINCQFVCPEPVTLEDNNVATNLYRIAQEAVTNAVRHADPDHIAVQLRRETSRHSSTGLETSVVLQVDNDGCPPATEQDGTSSPSDSTPDDTSAGGSGLRIMRHRAERLGGSFTFSSSDSEGTRIICRIPVPR